MSKISKKICGPNGTFRVYKQDKILPLPANLWTVEEVLDGPSLNSAHVGVFGTVAEAVDAAHRIAGLTAFKPQPVIPKVDRRGLVEHSRKL